jgi:hypothetical protein
MGTFPTPTVSFRRNPAGTAKIVIAAPAIALDIAVESRPSVEVCIVDRISGGFSDVGGSNGRDWSSRPC